MNETYIHTWVNYLVTMKYLTHFYSWAGCVKKHVSFDENHDLMFLHHDYDLYGHLKLVLLYQSNSHDHDLRENLYFV